MKKVMILMLSLIMLSGSAMGQRRVRMTQEQMTEKMVNELKLDEKQTKKVTKLNKKFKKLIEGEQQDKMKGQRPPMGQGRPEGNHGGGRPGGGFGGGMPGGGNITNATGDTVSTETGKVDVTLGDGCIWTLTGDTFITSFTGDASQIKLNGHRLFVNGKMTAQAGTDSQ